MAPRNKLSVVVAAPQVSRSTRWPAAVANDATALASDVLPRPRAPNNTTCARSSSSAQTRLFRILLRPTNSGPSDLGCVGVKTSRKRGVALLEELKPSDRWLSGAVTGRGGLNAGITSARRRNCLWPIGKGQSGRRSGERRSRSDRKGRNTVASFLHFGTERDKTQRARTISAEEAQSSQQLYFGFLLFRVSFLSTLACLIRRSS